MDKKSDEDLLSFFFFSFCSTFLSFFIDSESSLLVVADVLKLLL